MVDATKPEEKELADKLMKDLAAQGVNVEELAKNGGVETGAPKTEPSVQTPPEEKKEETQTTEDVVFAVDETLVKAKVLKLNDLDDYLIIKLHKKATLIIIGILLVTGLVVTVLI